MTWDSPLVLIDGDVACYNACKPRWQDKTKKVGGFSVISLDDDGSKVPLEYSEEENQKYLEESWNNFPKEIETILEACFADEYLMAVKSPTNFRDDLYCDYKANRRNSQPQLKPIVPRIREMAVMSGMAIPAVNREADDYLRIWANECIAIGRPYIISSIDKDLHCIPGLHHNIKKGTFLNITPEEARRHYFAQLIAGDPTDHIPGVPGMGMVKALKALEGATTLEEYQEIVVDQYFRKFGEEDWYDQLLINGKLIHLQGHVNDWFQLRDWPLVQELRG